MYRPKKTVTRRIVTAWTIPATGVVYLKKGGKLRWEYTQPTPQEIVSDGKTLWVYTPALNQVNVAPAPEALAGPAGSFAATRSGQRMSLQGRQREYAAFGCSRSAGTLPRSVIATCE